MSSMARRRRGEGRSLYRGQCGVKYQKWGCKIMYKRYVNGDAYMVCITQYVVAVMRRSSGLNVYMCRIENGMPRIGYTKCTEF